MKSVTSPHPIERGPPPACSWSACSSDCCPPSKRSPEASRCIGKPSSVTGVGDQDIAEPAKLPEIAKAFSEAPDADDERAEWSDEELEAEETEQIEALTEAAGPGPTTDGSSQTALWAREQALLDRLQMIADERRHLPDAKTRRLIDWIRENLCPALPPLGEPAEGRVPQWNNRRVLIFTENRQGTKRYLKSILEYAIEGTDQADDRHRGDRWPDQRSPPNRHPAPLQ